MKHLVYGILRERAVPGGPWPGEGEGGRVALVVVNGLAAAFSVATATAPEVSRLLDYARVIATLSRGRTLLPMRYGCLLDGTSMIQELLRRRHARFDQALRELDGCVEMGVRVLLDASPRSAPKTEEVPLAGAAYLAARQALYLEKDGRVADADAVSAHVRAAFSGLALQSRTEPPASACGRLLSLHFLIHAENVERFRQAFQRFQATQREKTLLTGPWPLYNFVPA